MEIKAAEVSDMNKLSKHYSDTMIKFHKTMSVPTLLLRLWVMGGEEAECWSRSNRRDDVFKISQGVEQDG